MVVLGYHKSSKPIIIVLTKNYRLLLFLNRYDQIFSGMKFFLENFFKQNIRNYISNIQMGAEQSIFIDQDFDRVPIYCIGFSEDIHFASDDEATNRILAKLKSYEANKMFKYRINNRNVFEYFYRYCQGVLVLKPFRERGIKVGVISIMRGGCAKIMTITAILKKQLKLDEQEALFIYEHAKLLKPYQKITFENMAERKKTPVIELQYSKLQILG